MPLKIFSVYVYALLIIEIYLFLFSQFVLSLFSLVCLTVLSVNAFINQFLWKLVRITRKLLNLALQLSGL